MYNSLSFLYSNMTTNSTKERLSTVLEPLQSMIQIALLSFSPIGSKLSIYENLLSIQLYKWSQPFIRNYYNDKKDDLYYLFNVINRFNKFYVNKSKTEDETRLFELINELAYNGLYNLIQTYSAKNDKSIINTLNMYKSMIKNPLLCEAYEKEKSNNDIILYNTNLNTSDNDSENESENESKNLIQNSIQNNNNKILSDIDDLFINIKSLYNEHHYKLLYNFLILIKNDTANHSSYIEGINIIFSPINNEIKNWINNNLSG